MGFFFSWWFGFLVWFGVGLFVFFVIQTSTDYFHWACSRRPVRDKLHEDGDLLSQTRSLIARLCWCRLLSSKHIGFVILTAFEKGNCVITDSAGKFLVLHEDLVDLNQSLKLVWVQVCVRTCRMKKNILVFNTVPELQ